MNEVKSVAGYFSNLMTIRQVAEALGVTPEAIKKHVREMYPENIKNGIMTYLDEEQVTEIKRRMVPTTEVVAAVTSLDIERMTLQVIQYHASKVKELETALAIAGPKAESHDAMMRSEKTMSITQCAKHFGVHPKTEVFPYLRERGYLTSKDLSSQDALDADILALVETRDRYTDAIYPQAVVRVCQLEKWRTVVVPNIEKWKDE